MFSWRGPRHAPTAGSVLEEFQHTLTLIADPASLYPSVVRAFAELFQCERLALLVSGVDSRTLCPVAQVGFEEPALAGLCLDPSDHLISWLRVNEIPFEVDSGSGIFQFLSPAEQSTLERLGISVCSPLISRNRIIGLILLVSPRRRDPHLLQAVSAQTALAIENALLYRRQMERVRHMYRAEKLAAAGQLAAGVAHEIRNPLTAIRSTAQLLARDPQADPENRELLEAVLTEVDRINQIITQLLSFARSHEIKAGTVDLSTLAEISLDLVAAQARLQGVDIVRRLEPLPSVPGDTDEVKQLLLNLLLNSLQAMPHGGELRVQSSPAESGVSLQITDTGCGIPPDALDRIFDPFFTTKPDGTGLGLSVAYAIIERHRGEIAVRSAPGAGTTVSLKLPLR